MFFLFDEVAAGAATARAVEEAEEIRRRRRNRSPQAQAEVAIPELALPGEVTETTLNESQRRRHFVP